MLVSQLKYKINANKKYHYIQKINNLELNLQYTKSINTQLRLPFFSHLQQIWRWRRNRKSFNSWRSIRSIYSGRLNNLVFLRHQTFFRVWLINKRFFKWRLQQNKLNCNFVVNKKYRQNLNQKTHCNFQLSFQRHLGNNLIELKQIRTITNLPKLLIVKAVLVNGRLIFDNILGTDRMLSNFNIRKTSFHYKKYNGDFSHLINTLICLNTVNPYRIYTYNPQLQRHLNFYYLNR